MLYRLDLPEPPPYTKRMVVSPEQFEDGTYQPVGTLVPVEPCEHGAIERHSVYADDAVEIDGYEWSIFEKWCDGAALKGDT